MARILIVFGTNFGHTTKVAAIIAAVAREYGHMVEVAPANRLPHGFSLEPYAALFIGGSVIATRHQTYLRRFVRCRRTELAGRPCAFFSVSGLSAGARPREQAEARHFVDRFLQQTGWKPDQVALFAGAVCYSRYDILTRWMMRFFMARQGGDTDTSRDYEYTDWQAVRIFTETFLARVAVT